MDFVDGADGGSLAEGESELRHAITRGYTFRGSEALDCDFETGFCDWIQRQQDDIDWSIGVTSANKTGPNGDHTTGGGSYAYIDTTTEDTKINNRSIRAVLASPNTTNDTYCLSLWYFMHGNLVDTLRIFKTEDNKWTRVFEINGSQDQRWLLKTRNISLTPGSRITIVGKVDYSNSHGFGVIAIDDILVFPGQCPTACDDPTPTFGFVDSEIFKLGSVVKITCKGGYTLTGRSSVTCQANGVWNDKPECHPKAVFGTTFGRTARQSCNYGYILKGPDTTECTESGWNGTGGQFFINDCGDPTPISGNVSSSNFKYKSQLEIACNPGYTLVGNSSIICQANGNWSNNPVCEPIDCFTPLVPHGITSGMDKDTTYNKTVMLECADGYTLSGNKLVTCQSDGNWSSLPECLVQDSSSKPVTMLYILGPVFVVILVTIIFTILFRKVFHKSLEKFICFRKSTRKGKTESGNFRNVTYSGHDVETQSDRESHRSQDTNEEDAPNKNKQNVFTVNCKDLDTMATENEYENDNRAQMENTATDIFIAAYSHVSNSKCSNEFESNYDQTFNRTPKNFRSIFDEQNNRYDYLEVSNLQKKFGENTQNSTQKDLDPTYNHTHVDIDQINQSNLNDYSHLMEMPLTSSESKETYECEYINAAVISEDEVCYENAHEFEAESHSTGLPTK